MTVDFTESATRQTILAFLQPNLTITIPPTTGNPKPPSGSFKLADVRKAFAQDAVFVLYGCNVGQSPALVQAFADVLGVKAIGFRDKVTFCAGPGVKGKFIRKGMKIGIKSCLQKTADWRGLITDPAAVVRAPSAAGAAPAAPKSP